MFDPHSREHLDRLALAMDRSRYLLEPFRRNRLALLTQFCGAHYSDSAAPQRVPLNLLQLAANIYLRQLVSRAPRAMAGTRDPQLKPVAADMEAWLNRATVGMRLGESLRICVMNALFGLGVMKVGEAKVGEVEIYGTTHHIGQPFADAVDFDDLWLDLTAKRFDQCQFIGNRFRVRLEEAKANSLWDKQARAALTAQTRFAYNERGDLRVTTLSGSTQQLFDADVEDHVELVEVYLPREQMVLTLQAPEAAGQGISNQRPLNAMKWNGPSDGPFLFLAYSEVPNNIMPCAPMAALWDLHDLVNILWRKLGRQGERQKELLVFSGLATDDAKRFMEASDGEAVKGDLVDKLKPVSWGGIKPENLVGADTARQLFKEMAGNLDSLGGLSPQAQTLGQDEMLAKNASAQVSEMQDRTVSFAESVYRSLAFHWWANPVLTYSASRTVAGQQVPVSVTPEMRQRPFEDLDFGICPYSMVHQTPQSRLAFIKDALGTLGPLMPMLAQQGVTLDGKALADLLAKYGNNPDLADVFKQGPPPDQQAAQEGASGMKERVMAPNTTRTQKRVNIPGQSDRSQGQMLAQMMAGARGPNGVNNGTGQ